MISTLIFDLSEVQLTGIKGVEHKLASILKISPAEIKSTINSEDFAVFLNGQITEDEYWIRTIRRGAWNIKLGAVKQIARENFVKIEGTREIIENLREKGYRLGLLSVQGKEWANYVEEKFGYHRLFHSVLYSFEVAVSKPDKKAYQIILERLKAKPDECVFIDDHQKNLVPAEELGMKTILFTGPEKLREDLKALGISF